MFRSPIILKLIILIFIAFLIGNLYIKFTKVENLETCNSRAHENFSRDWNKECRKRATGFMGKYGPQTPCVLESEFSEELHVFLEEEIELCQKKYIKAQNP